MFNMYKVI